MNGQTLELESSHRLTVAPAGGDDPKTVTVTVQDGQRVALAHLTAREAFDAAASLAECAEHVDPTAVVDVREIPEFARLTEELAKRDATIAELQGELDGLHLIAASKVSAPIDALEDPKVEILEGETPDEVA